MAAAVPASRSPNGVWVTEPDDEINIRLGATEPASWTPQTVVQVMKDTTAKHGDKPAMHLKRLAAGVEEADANWTVWSWNRYLAEVRAFAKGLIHLGCSPRGTTNIIGFNSPEWFIANTGTIFADMISAGIYATNLSDACKYVSEHSKAELVVCDGLKQLKKYETISQELPHLKALVVYGEAVSAEFKASWRGKPVYGWDEFLALGAGVTDEQLNAREVTQRPGQCCTLIYTSGTTGPPKAVMISHDNITWTTSCVIKRRLPALDHTERFISYLPLSHIAAQIIDIHAPMNLGSSVYFAQPDALKGSLGKTMALVRPTIFFGVPRVWEKMMEKMHQMAARVTGIKKSLSTWAKSCGSARSQRAQFGGSGGAPCGFGLANMLVLSKIKAALGLDQCKGAFTAAAPIAVDVLEYFASLDIHVFEVFGQSECTGPHTASVPGAWKIGYCGRPLEGTESKCDENNNELCYRGRHIFMGYMYGPTATASTIDEEGWLHSGDVAEFDGNDHPTIPAPSGFMRITGRIKELIITAGGENIPPVIIEQEMKAAMPALGNCMVIGDRRKFLTILLTLMTEADEQGAPTSKLVSTALLTSQRIGSTATTVEEAATCDLWKKYFNDGVKTANSRTTSQAQIVQKWTLLSRDFSEKTGELTPTLKLKRSVVAKTFEREIEAMYSGAGDS